MSDLIDMVLWQTFGGDFDLTTCNKSVQTLYIPVFLFLTFLKQRSIASLISVLRARFGTYPPHQFHPGPNLAQTRIYH